MEIRRNFRSTNRDHCNRVYSSSTNRTTGNTIEPPESSGAHAQLLSGGSSDGDPPDPISNSAVKPISANDSLRVKVGHCQFMNNTPLTGSVFVYKQHLPSRRCCYVGLLSGCYSALVLKNLRSDQLLHSLLNIRARTLKKYLVSGSRLCTSTVYALYV